MNRTLTIAMLILSTTTYTPSALSRDTSVTIDRRTGAITHVTLSKNFTQEAEVSGTTAGVYLFTAPSIAAAGPDSPRYQDFNNPPTMDECRDYEYVQNRLRGALPLTLSPVSGSNDKYSEVVCISGHYLGSILLGWGVRWVGTVADAAAPVSCTAPAKVTFDHGTVRGGDIEGDTVTLSYVIRCDGKTSAQVSINGLNANQNVPLSSDIASELYWDEFKLTATGTTVKMDNGDNNVTLKSILRAPGGAATPGKYTNSSAILNITFD